MTDPTFIDAFCVGFGGFAPPIDTALAVTVLEAEAEWREDGWEALGLVLDCIVDGVFTWPEHPADRAAVFEAVWRLGWMGTPRTPGEDDEGGAIG